MGSKNKLRSMKELRKNNDSNTEHHELEQLEKVASQTVLELQIKELEKDLGLDQSS